MNSELSTIKTWSKQQPSSYQLRDITHFPDWHKLIVLDAFFNNLTSGLMLMCVILWLAAPVMLANLLPIALTLALIFLVIDLIILVLDLGDPAHFIHALRVMRFTSPLSVGVWALVAYGAFLSVAVLSAWISFAASGGTGIGSYMLAAIMRLCVFMAAIAAIVVICYKGVVFSCSSQPGLAQARWLPPFMVSDSLLMGMGIITILIGIFSDDKSLCVVLILPFITLLTARCIAFGLLWQDVKYRARTVYTKQKIRLTAFIVYIAGSLLPLVLLFLGTGGIILAGCLVLATGLYERSWLIGLPTPVKCGQVSPKHEQEK